MPVALSCNCGKQLRVSEDHLGKRIRCPACGEALLVEESKPGKAAAKKSSSPTPSGGTASGMLTFSCECGKKMQAKAEYAGRTVKCPDCGEAIKVPKSGGDSAPARKKDADADDDAPLSKRLDGLLAKSGRKKAAPDESDEAPARGRRDEDDEYPEDDPDEDERPKKGKKGKKSKKGGSMLPVVLISLGVLLLLGVGALAFLFLGGGSASGDMALIPGNAGGFATIRVADLMATQAGKDILAAMPPGASEDLNELESKIGLTRNDINRVTMVLLSVDEIAGAAMGRRGAPPEMYMIVSTNKAIEQTKVLDGFEMKDAASADHNGKKMFSRGNNALYFHSDRVLVAGPPNGVRKAIDQAVKPRTDGQLSKITSQVGSQHLVVGFGIPASLSQMKAMIPPTAAQFAPIADVQQMMIVGNVSGTSLALDVTGMYPDSAKAGEAKTALDDVKAMAALVPNMPPEGAEALRSLTINNSGSNVVLSMKSSLDMNTIKGAMAGMPGFGGGRPPIRPGGGNPGGGNPGGGIPGGGGGVMGVRDTADRSKDANNLKQIALAFHNLHDTMGSFNWAIYGQNRQPLLSWRVAILPYIGEQGLYNQIKKDEAWNSPTNRQFHNRMPKLFEMPGRTAAPGMTYYQVFTGPGALFDPRNPQGRRLSAVTDGTSGTLLVTEGAVAVNWMEPKDITYLNNPTGFQTTGKVGGRFPTGFNAAFADGAVKFIERNRNPQELKAMITAEGGEPVLP